MTKPSFELFLANEKGEGDDKKTFWTKVGAAWPNKAGTGFNIDIPAGLSISGRVTMLPYREPDEE